jgi:hypothetical protein
MLVTTNFASSFARLMNRRGRWQAREHRIRNCRHIRQGDAAEDPVHHSGTVDFTKALGAPKKGGT